MPRRALAVNAFGVRSLARAATEVGATFVHYGSDFVFDGEATEPYTEDDTPNPRSVYGASKLLGEWFAADAPRAYVLRVESLFGGAPPRSSVDRIIDAVAKGEEAKVFSDRVVSPRLRGRRCGCDQVPPRVPGCAGHVPLRQLRSRDLG